MKEMPEKGKALGDRGASEKFMLIVMFSPLAMDGEVHHVWP